MLLMIHTKRITAQRSRFGSQVTIARLQQDMSLRELAEKADLPWSTLQSWIIHDLPNREQIIKLADNLGMTLDDLLR